MSNRGFSGPPLTSANPLFSAKYLVPDEDEVDSDVLQDSDDENHLPSVSHQPSHLPTHIENLGNEKENKQVNSSSYTQMDEEIENYLNENEYGASPSNYLDEDEQIYQLFVQSVHDEQVAESIIGISDDDDDEYNPDQSDDDLSDEADDMDDGDNEAENDGEDEDLENEPQSNVVEETEEPQAYKVQAREIRDLLNECWLEIAGSKPAIPNNYPYPSQPSSSAHNHYAHNMYNSPNSSSMQLGGDQTSNDNSLDLPSSNPHTDGVATPKPSASLISNIVQQLITGQKLPETFLDGLPLSAIRKIVARQMSMALQLLIQIMLQAEDHSECFDKCYQQLLILSNLRNTAVKKARLFQMNLELLKNISASAINTSGVASDSQNPFNLASNQNLTKTGKSLKENQFQQILMEVAPDTNPLQHLSHHFPLLSQPSSSNPLTSQVVSMKNFTSTQSNANNNNQQQRKIMTRSSLVNQSQMTNDRTSSIFDIPILSKIHEFMMKIDLKKKDISHELLPFKSSTLLNPHSHSHHLSLTRAHNNSLLFPPTSASTLNQQLIAALEPKLKLFKFLLYEQSIKQLYRDYELKYWNCLVPKSNYPFLSYGDLLQQSSSSSTTLSSSHYSLLNPMTIEGRKFFTPAEDDLLLKGIIEYGGSEEQHHPQHQPRSEIAWVKIQKKFLSFKKLELLQFHYHEKTLFSNHFQNNDFKRHQFYLERMKLNQQNSNFSNMVQSNMKASIPSLQNQYLMNGGSTNHTVINNGNVVYRKKDDKWSSLEDICLLKAFQVFGEKYPLISLFSLSHRSAAEVRNRWIFHQNVWNRAFNLQRRKFLLKNPTMVIIYDNIPVMSNEVRAFLRDANDCKNYHQLQELWMKGGVHMRKLNVNQDEMNIKENASASVSSRKNETNQSKEEKDFHLQPSQGNQINWTSIMDDVSDFEQDTLPDSSEDEQEEDQQIIRAKAREQGQIQSLNQVNAHSHSQLVNQVSTLTSKSVLPSIFSQQIQYPASSSLLLSENSLQNSLPTSSLTYPTLNSQQLPPTYSNPPADRYQEPVSAVVANNQQLHYPPSLLQQQPIGGHIHQLDAKPKKKRKHVSDNTVIDPKIHLTKSEKKAKISNDQKKTVSGLPLSQAPKIIQNENTTDMMQLILPTFLENSMVSQQKEISSSLGKPDVSVPERANSNPIEATNTGQGKIIYDEFTLDFTKLFNQESNMGNLEADIRKDGNGIALEGNSNISFHSPNSSSSGLFASVMMNASQK